jgi:hypothetical protein
MEDSNDYENMLITILETSKLTRAETDPLSNEDSFKKQEDEVLNCLKIEDNTIEDYLDFETKFQTTCARQIEPTVANNLIHNLNEMSFINYRSDQMPSVGIMNNIESMVESVYNHDRAKINQIAEEICYIKKLASNWRTIGGDGNCFYRSAIFGYLETIIFERDILKLKSIIIEIDQKFDENYINTKYLNKAVKDPIVRLNKRLVISILYIIYDILDMSNGSTEDLKKAYCILIKAMNNSTTFDIVNYYFNSLGDGVVSKI